LVDFSVQNVCTPSPEILKVTTSKRKYNSSDGQIRNQIKAQPIVQQTLDSSTFPTTPRTKAWVSELINLPSPIKKSNLKMCTPKKMNIKNNYYKKSCKK